MGKYGMFMECQWKINGIYLEWTWKGVGSDFGRKVGVKFHGSDKLLEKITRAGPVSKILPILECQKCQSGMSKIQ